MVPRAAIYCDHKTCPLGAIQRYLGQIRIPCELRAIVYVRRGPLGTVHATICQKNTTRVPDTKLNLGLNLAHLSHTVDHCRRSYYSRYPAIPWLTYLNMILYRSLRSGPAPTCLHLHLPQPHLPRLLVLIGKSPKKSSCRASSARPLLQRVRHAVIAPRRPRARLHPPPVMQRPHAA